MNAAISSAAPTRKPRTASPFSVGRRQGWLTPDGLEEICSFIRPSKGSSMHFSGSHRCEAMRACYADPKVR